MKKTFSFLFLFLLICSTIVSATVIDGDLAEDKGFYETIYEASTLSFMTSGYKTADYMTQCDAIADNGVYRHGPFESYGGYNSEGVKVLVGGKCPVDSFLRFEVSTTDQPFFHDAYADMWLKSSSTDLMSFADFYLKSEQYFRFYYRCYNCELEVPTEPDELLLCDGDGLNVMDRSNGDIVERCFDSGKICKDFDNSPTARCVTPEKCSDFPFNTLTECDNVGEIDCFVRDSKVAQCDTYSNLNCWTIKENCANGFTCENVDDETHCYTDEYLDILNNECTTLDRLLGKCGLTTTTTSQETTTTSEITTTTLIDGESEKISKYWFFAPIIIAIIGLLLMNVNMLTGALVVLFALIIAIMQVVVMGI